MLPEVGELVFSFVVGYMGALEFLYVVRHLYHWGFKHNPEMRDYKSEAESLRKLQDQLKNAIAEAKEREELGLKAMKDGVEYKDGFRIDEDRMKIEELKELVRIQEKRTERQREIEEELQHQRKIEEETKKQLKQAEEELRRVEEEKAREKRRVEEEHRKAEEAKRRAEEDKRKAQEEEKQRKQREEEEKQRKHLEEEEEKQRKQREEEEESKRKIFEAEKKREEEQRLQEEQAENERKLLQAEKEREEKQRLQEIEDEKKKQEDEKRRQAEEEKENELKLLQAEKEMEEKQKLQEIEDEKKRQEQEEEEERKTNELKLLQEERDMEEKQRLLEIEDERKKQEEQQRLQEEEERENELRLYQAEREREEKQRQQEIEDEKVVQKLLAAEREREREERENTERLIAAEKEAIQKQREQEENDENVRNLLKAERELELKKQEMEEEAANLQRLIEAEKEMEDRQRKVDEEALLKLKNAQEEMELRQAFDAEADEEAFVKKEIGNAEQSITPTQTVKTQYGQTVSESLKPKTLLFPEVSEESSAEPVSSMQSSFSTQQSSEAALPELHFDEYERQAPDGGEDMPSLQYSDDYLRSLDGIKNKPLVREDGSGRRRAFKKRRSSGSSTSSRESRASREEELKMFTSLEEEEFENIRKGDSEYETIKYASEPNLKVGKQHRRHKRSPAKDAKRDPNDKGSLEMLDEEESNPWGEVKPENYKNTEFWKREKNLSIDEEQEEYDAKQRIQPPSTDAINIPKMSSFEEATKSQHEEAISVLQRQRSKEPEPIIEPDEESDTKHVSRSADDRQSPAGSNSSPASASASITPALKSPEPKREKSLEAEDKKTRTPSPTTGLRRSPRVDEMKEYAEKWKTDDLKARVDAGENPAIEIDYASDEEPMSPEHLMEGISDFYDFNASINPSRSRSRSRSKTPAVNRSVSLPERRSPSPLNCSHIPARSKSRSPSPDPASYKFIYERIMPSLTADQEPPPDNGLSDNFDFHSKLNREALSATIKRRSSEVHRTSVDYVLEDLRIDKVVDGGGTANKIQDLRNTPSTPEYDRSISAEMRDIEKLKEEIMSGSFKRSTYVGESMDFSDQFESLREEAKLFRRSRSRSRSPVYDVEEMTARLLAKKELQEKILEDITKNSEISEDFMPEITKNMVDRNRRSSDTALIQKPEIIFQIQDLIEETDENFNLLECEPEEYHHFRRFSLGQEIPVEQYPEDYAFVSEIEIKTLEDLQAWTADLEELPSGEIVLPKLAAFHEQEQEENLPRDQNRIEEAIEEAYESGSDDERQTVVEVDDGIDEEIWDYNERPAEESHNEQSECEEADREMDRYAGRNADDWRDVEGAVGGVSDEDSFQIDQIYDEAIKNRKTSGILRDYDCILKDIQISDEDLLEEVKLLEKSSFSNGKFSNSSEHDILSPRSRSSRASSRDSSISFIEYEKRDNEMRYLADPAMSAINSTRLRSRYGIVPSTSLPTGFEDDTIDVDVNYVPKKEYNWRKNFKLDDDAGKDKTENDTQYLDSRKFSLGGESITLFSQSPENSELKRVIEKNEEEQLDEEMEQEPEEMEKPTKKKKSKRKSRKDSKGSIGGNDDEKENVLSRRSSIVAEGDLPKKKSKRESKKAVDTLVQSVNQEGVPQQEEETEDLQKKNKSKKRRKVKDEIILPKLDVIIPTPEKKAPPPSVAALRAALSAPSPPTELKPAATLNKPRRLWETPSPMFGKEIPKVESNIRFSVSPQPSTTLAPNLSNIRAPEIPHLVPTSTAKETDKSDLLRLQNVEQTNSFSKTNESSSLPNGTLPTEMSNSKPKVQETETAASENGVSSEMTEIQTSKSLQNSELEDSIATKVDQKQNIETGKSELPEAPNAISEPTPNPTATSEPEQIAKLSVSDASDATKNGGLYSQSNISASKTKTTPESDILKDGGLYPLF